VVVVVRLVKVMEIRRVVEILEVEI